MSDGGTIQRIKENAAAGERKALREAMLEAVKPFTAEIKEGNETVIEIYYDRFVPLFAQRLGVEIDKLTQVWLGVIGRCATQQCVDAYGFGRRFRLTDSRPEKRAEKYWAYRKYPRGDAPEGVDAENYGRDQFRRWYSATLP